MIPAVLWAWLAGVIFASPVITFGIIYDAPAWVILAFCAWTGVAVAVVEDLEKRRGR